ncbi:MAG TPA: SDR family NAD(P)-dependent oxidoreductase [Vicinamibacterales bacterium]|nr:SDR family NAD(P)-dependent oxidoreductase [Vicinamibacterales bacterium]
MKNLFSLEGKTVAVIGAGSGIGQAVAIGAAQQGAHVWCLDIHADTAAETAAMITKAGATADSGIIDITNMTSVNDAIVKAASTHNRLDGVVCTPAINVRKPILKYSGDEFDRVVQVNLRGTFNVLQSAGWLMVPQGSGSIVLFSSIRSIVTEPGQSVYSMTKSGILQLAKTAAAEWGTSGVRVNAVGPGVIETPLTAPIKQNPEWYNAYAMKNPMNRWAQASEMAGPTVFLLSDAASYVTGTILYADGGWLAADGRFTPPGM